MIVFLQQLQEQHLQHDWYTVSSPTVFCLPLCSYLSTMNRPSRGKTHAVARTSEWAVSAVESLSSTQTKKKKRKPLCIPGAAGFRLFYLRDPPSGSWSPGGSALLLCPPRPRHRSSVGQSNVALWSATHFMRAECV